LSREFDVAVMHDFFVDRFVEAGTIGAVLSTVDSKAEIGGGGVHGVRQLDFRGGNAVNLAVALSTLGLRTLLITHSDEDHLPLLRNPFKGLPAEVRVKPLRAGLTVAIEGRVNVMLSDNGGAGNFGPELLDSNDWNDIASAGLVCSVNWAANARGTDLLRALRERTGRTKAIFLGTSDFSDRHGQFRDLLRLQRRLKLFNWLALNEIEATAAARLSETGGKGLTEICSILSLALGSRVDIHTRVAGYTADGGAATRRPTRIVRARRLTGAGDVWDAASIFGKLNGMEDGGRLDFANAAARLYITASEPRPPTEKQVFAELG